MDEEIVDDMVVAIIHWGETSEEHWSAEESAKFLIQCLMELGYDITPRTDMVLN